MLKFFSRRINNKKGFTLIELIVVIAILAILALIAIPRIGQFRTQAAISTHNANVRTLESAATMCLAQEGLPGDAGVAWDGATSTHDTHKWEDYVAAWPTVPQGVKQYVDDDSAYTVEIDKDGEVDVNPWLLDEKGNPVSP